MFHEKKVIYLLIKFGELDHLVELRDRGRVCMRSLNYFIECERDAQRYDRNEGLHAIHQAENIEIKIDCPDGKSIVLNRDNGLCGQVKIGFKDTQSILAFCLFAVTNKSKDWYINPKNFAFGSHALVITNVKMFIERMEKGIRKEGLEFKHGLIEYIDERKFNGEMGPFKKFQKFDYQNEFRCLGIGGKGSPYFLDVGSLADISYIFESKMLEHLNILERN